MCSIKCTTCAAIIQEAPVLSGKRVVDQSSWPNTYFLESPALSNADNFTLFITRLLNIREKSMDVLQIGFNSENVENCGSKKIRNWTSLAKNFVNKPNLHLKKEEDNNNNNNNSNNNSENGIVKKKKPFSN